jgi:tape measure domain-containing protein
MAGQDAQLLLKVGLDLTAFRQSLAGLGAASAGYSLPINIKISRDALNKELANLTSALGKKKFKVELDIAGGLTEDQLGKIQERLKTLAETKKVEIPVSVIARASKEDLRKVVASLNRSVRYSDALVNGKLRVPATIVSSITKADVNAFAVDARRQLAGIKAGVSLEVSDTSINAFKEKVKSKLSGIAVDVTANVKSNFAAGPTGLAGLEEYMRTQGASGGHVSGGAAKGAAETARSVLFEKTVSEATNKDLKRMMQVGEVTGRSGLTTKSQMQEALMKLGSDAQEKILGNLKMQMSEPPRKISRSFLDQVARAVLWMAGVDPEYLRQQAAQPKKKQPQKPFGLLPSVTAKGSMEDMMRMLSGGGDAGESGKLALSSEQLKARVDAILRDYFRIVEVQVKEVFDAPLQLRKQINTFDYLVQALRDAEQAAKQSKIDAAVSRLINSIEEIINKAEASARASAAMSRLGQVNVREISNASFVKPGQLLLPQGEARKMLPGRPSQASILELNNILAGAIEAYFKSVAAGIRRAPIDRTPLIGPGGGGKDQLMLPAAGETTAFNRIRVTTGASVGQPAPMRAPSIPPPLFAGGGGTGSIPPRGGGGGRGGGFLGGMQFNMPQLPGTGVVASLGVEFGNAAKQVLLFGTAYKALALVTDFPAQVGAAVAQLQAFNNTLKSISPNAREAAASNQLILSIVEQYKVPVQSARDGFTKLYASMQPAGFSGDQIRDLFTGISKSAATFGMSADKVDRVNYAFAQMASKGQVMSEELKGQLGDVLPGAMAIFAEAAGFKGPKAIQDFSKSLEDGVYKGQAMVALLNNVGVLMNTKFAAGAKGAAQTFQGAINDMQNSMTFLYQSFEPVAVGFLGDVVRPLIAGINQLTDGFNSFFTGAGTKTAGGFAIAQELEKLKPTFEGLRANAIGLGEVLGEVTKIVLAMAKIFLQLAANPFTGYLLKLSVIAVSVNTALSATIAILGIMRGIWAANVVQLLLFNARLVTGTGTLSAFRSMMQATGATSTTTSAAIRAAGLTLRTFFATTGIGLIIVGISMLIERFTSMNQALADTKAQALGAAQAIRSMSQTEARQAENQASRDVEVLLNLQDKNNAGKQFLQITEEQNAALRRAGVPTGRITKSGLTSKEYLSPDMGIGAAGGSLGVDATQLTGALQQAESRAAEAAYRIRTVKFEEQQAQIAPTLQAIPLGEDKKAQDKAAREAEKLAKLQDKLAGREQQLAIDAANRQTALDDSTFAHKLAMSDAHYDHLKALQEDSFNREMSGLDSIEARQRKFQQDLKAIESRRIDSIRKAEVDAQKAVQDFRTASVKAGAASGSGGGMGGGPTALNVTGAGFTLQQLQKASQEASKFTGVADMCSESVKAFYKSLGITLPGVTAWADTVRNAGTVMTDFSKIQAGDILATGRPGDTPHVGVYTGGQNVFHQSSRRGLKAGNYPDLNYFKSGYFVRPSNVTTPRSQVGLKTRPGEYAIGRNEDKTSGQLAVEMLGMQQGEEKRLLAIRYANKLAIEQTITTIRQNIDTIFPVKEQQLENDLLELRNKLELQGVSKEVIDMEVQKTKNIKESAAAQASATKEMISSKTALKQLQDKKTLTEDESIYMGYLVEKIAGLNREMATLPSKQEAFNVQLARTAELVAAQKTPQAILANTAAALKTQYAEMTNLGTVATNVASTISGAFGTAFQGVISGSVTAQQALSTFFQSVGEAFLDMAAKMIAKWMEMQIIGLAQQLLGAGLGAIGGGLGGFNLGGEGSGIGGAVGSYGGAMSPTTSLPSFSNSFGSFSGGGFGVTSSFGSFAGGVKTFAEGGIPPIGVPSLVGEQGPELFVPRSMGTIVPAGPTAGIREAMANGNGQSNVSPILNMTFQSSTINGVEYVSRDQLEAAMQETRRQASRDGAKRGMTMTLDKLQQSPATRSRIGI